MSDRMSSNGESHVITALEKKAKLLTKRTNKDEKLLRMQKQMFDKHTQKLNLKIANLEQLIKDKDKELRMQALKIKELMNADPVQKKQIIQRDFSIL